MEPISKKRKLAPKPNFSPPTSPGHAASTSQGPIHGHEPPLHHLPRLQPQPPQLQTYAAQAASSTFPPPRSPHDERRDFEAFARHLQDAAMLIQRQLWRQSQPQSLPYSDVSVLMLKWEDDHSVDEDFAAVEQVFQSQYNFRTHRCQIPNLPNPNIKLSLQMGQVLDSVKPDQLLIIYYAGHGFVDANGQLFWACGKGDDAVKLKWDGVRCLFEEMQSDILLLLDTCALPDQQIAGSHGTKQAIAARPSDHDPRNVDGQPFSYHLVMALRQLAGERSFNAQRLHEEIVQLQHQHRVQSPQSKIASGPSNNESLAPQNAVFFTLNSGKPANIVLGPILYPTPTSQTADEGLLAQAGFGSEQQLASIADVRLHEPKQLVCTTFVGEPSPDMSSFKQWLHRTWPQDGGIVVEGLFLGPPTVLLISLPIPIWHAVQHDKVCTDLGKITSHNMLPLYKTLADATTRFLPSKDNEFGIDSAIEISPLRARNGSTGGYELGRRQSEYSSAAPKSDGNDVEGSVEMQEAAEQLKALSHNRHHSNEGLHQSLARQAAQATRAVADGATDHSYNSNMAINGGGSPNVYRPKGAPQRNTSRSEVRCSQCDHVPFKDSSSLRKHVNAVHSRPFPCSLAFAGCTSTFGSKNEWKRHMASQHLCLQIYRCSACPQGSGDAESNKSIEFNRKDLFTQHLRRMHAPAAIKGRPQKSVDPATQASWESRIRDLQQTGLVTQRKPPQHAECSKPGCQVTFDGAGCWDEWTEHVGRHMEKGEASALSLDARLVQWAFDEGIIEPDHASGGYKLCGGGGASSNGASITGLGIMNGSVTKKPVAPVTPPQQSSLSAAPAPEPQGSRVKEQPEVGDAPTKMDTAEKMEVDR